MAPLPLGEQTLSGSYCAQLQLVRLTLQAVFY
jgi:hypothetical protein